MPRASMSAKDAVDVSFGIQEGVVEIVKAITKVHQYPPNKKTGEQGDPFPCVQITVIRCDADGKRSSEDEITEELGVGKLEKFHPGTATNAADEDPEDMGTEVDVEGNCIFIGNAGDHFAKTSKWIRFATSLEEKGFKSDVLGNGYMPDLVGTVMHVETKTLPKTPGYTGKNDPTALVATKILVFPYDKKKAKGPIPVAAKATASAPASASTTPKAGAVGATDDPEAIALKFLAELAEEMTGKEGIERKKLQTGVQTKLMRAKVSVKVHAPVLAFVKSDEWLTKVLTEDEGSLVYGKIMVDLDSGLCQFA